MNKYIKEYLEHYRLDLQFFSKRLIRTAAYIRVSHEEQKKHGFSVEAQREGLQKYANENGYIIVDWYIDEAKSARKKTGKRKEFTRLIQDAQEGNFELIIFKCIDRWFRNIQEYYRIQTILETHNINWECSEEEYDTTTREGRLKLNLYLMIAQDEADRTSERIKYVFENKIKNGEAIFGDASLPIGFKIKVIDDKKRVVIDEDKKEIVNEIFDLYETIKSKRQVHLLITRKYDLDIHYKVIQKMFKNTLYYGSYKDNDNYVYGESYLTKERWLQIQDIEKSNNKSTATKRNYLFSCLLKCQKCGNTLCGQTTTRKSGYSRVYYRCNTKFIKRQCDIEKNLVEENIEEQLLKNIKPYIEKYIASYNIKPSSKQKPKININKLKKELERLNYLYKKGRIEEEEYERDYQEIEDKIKSADIKEIKPKDFTYLKDLLESDIETIYKSLTRDEKIIFWRSFIKKVVMDHNTHEILDLSLL